MNIIGRMKIWFSISAATIIIGIIALVIYGLKPAIDFSGGSLLQLSVPVDIKTEDIRTILTDNGFEDVVITSAGQARLPDGQGRVLARSKPVDQEKKNTAFKAIKDKVGENKVGEERFETIGPTVSADLVKKAITSVILASFAIIAYIAFAFRKLPDKSLSWRFGLTAVLALLHDLLFTIGLFAIAGHFMGWEVDSLFITALLTVMGFSVHDTIVVFDRLRENIKRFPGQPFDSVVNASVIQTLARSLNTSLTILITLAALLLLGGETLRPFVFVLFSGILVGTYSSIFVASPLVVVWQKYLDRK